MSIDHTSIFDLGDELSKQSPFGDWLKRQKLRWSRDRQRRDRQYDQQLKQARGQSQEDRLMDDEKYRSYIRFEKNTSGHLEIHVHLHVVVVTTSKEGDDMPDYTRAHWLRVPEAFPPHTSSALNGTVDFDIKIHFVESRDQEERRKIKAGGALVAKFAPNDDSFGAAVYYNHKKEVAFKGEYEFGERKLQQVNHLNLASELGHRMGYVDRYFYDKDNDQYVTQEAYVNSLMGTANTEMKPFEADKIIQEAKDYLYMQKRVEKHGYFETKNGDVSAVMNDKKPTEDFSACPLLPADPVMYPTYEKGEVATYYPLRDKYGGRTKGEQTPLVERLNADD